MWAILAEAFGWEHRSIMQMTPRETRAYLAQVPALRAAEQQRWLVVMATAMTQNPKAIEQLSQDLMDIQKGIIARPRAGDSLITTDPAAIRAFLNSGGMFGAGR